MKKTIFFCLLAILWVPMVCRAGGVSAGIPDVVDSSDNRLVMKVLPAEDLSKIPVQVSMENPIPMTCVQCYIAGPDTINTFVHTDDAQKNVVYASSDRWASQHNVLFSWNTKSHPHTLMILVVSTQSENFKGDNGPIVTVYFDGSSLPDGEYSIKMTDANMVWTDRKSVTTYLTPDIEALFSIKAGKLVLTE